MPTKLLLILAICGCSASPPDGPAPQPAPSDAPPAKASEAAPPGAALDNPPPARAPAAIPPEPDGTLAEHMKDHFSIVAQARDAVIRGQLLNSEGPLIWLAQHSYEGEVPGEWKEAVAEMQAAARQSGEANGLQGQAQGVARIALACGQCHQRAGKHPRFAPQGFEDPVDPDEQEGVRGRMHRHLWASERMWEGLIGPSQANWTAGAQALADAGPPAGASKSVRAGAVAVTALGSQALTASEGAQRARIYGALLGRCASCHRETGVAPGR